MSKLERMADTRVLALLAAAFVLTLVVSSALRRTEPAVELRDPGSPVLPYADAIGSVQSLASLGTHPFLVEGTALAALGRDPRARNLVERYGPSVRRFDSVRDCLTREQRARERPNLAALDWSRLRGTEDAEVCIFLIASSYGSSDSMFAWLRAQGFDPRRHDVTAASGLYMVEGTWSVREHGVLFSANILDALATRLLAYGLGIGVVYDGAGRIYSVGVHYSVL